MGEARRRRFAGQATPPALRTMPRQVRIGPKLHAHYDEVYAIVTADCRGRHEEPPTREQFDQAVITLGLKVILGKTQQDTQRRRMVLTPEEVRRAAQDTRKLTVEVPPS